MTSLRARNLRGARRLHDASLSGLDRIGSEAVGCEEVDLGVALHESDDSLWRLFGVEAVSHERIGDVPQGVAGERADVDDDVSVVGCPWQFDTRTMVERDTDCTD